MRDPNFPEIIVFGIVLSLVFTFAVLFKNSSLAEPSAPISTQRLKLIANTASHAGGFKLPAKWPNITNAQADDLLVEMKGFVLENERITLAKEVLRGVSGK